MQIGYGSFEGDPCRWTETEAWVFARLPDRPGKWMAWDNSEILLGARVLNEETYLKQFPNLPALPAQAFHQEDAGA